jgi:hypothetical protein
MHRKKIAAGFAAMGVFAPSLALATNGMIMEGYGPVATGMGGAAMAYDNGTAAMANNPATLGLMAATREATQGKFPIPLILFTAFRAGPAKIRAMLTLGALYAAGFLLAMGGSYLVDGGGFARLYLGGSAPTAELLESPDFQTAMWVFIGLHLPLSLMFWHAPALVFWHDLPPLKSMFFSIVACFRNFWAFTVFGLSWMGTIVVTVLVIGILGNVMDNPGLSGVMLFPALMLLASMFFTSLYFTYRDSFELEPPGQEQAAT